MHINSIKIENFKGISRLEFKPKKINLIVGKNNSGKTSQLECLYLLFNSTKTDEMYSEHLGSIINVNSQNSLLKAETDEGKKELSLEQAEDFEVIQSFKKDVMDLFTILRQAEGKKDQLEKKVSELIDTELKSSVLFKQSIKTIEDKKDEIIYYHFEMGESIVRWKSFFNKLSEDIRSQMKDKEKLNILGSPDFLMHRLISRKTLFNKPASKEKRVMIIRDLLGKIRMASQRNDKEAVERLNEIERFIKEHKLIADLERLGFDYVIFEDSSGKKTIPFEFLGDGFKALVGILWSLSSREIQSKVILLDEPENYMHPGYVKELLKIIIMFADKFDIQFFIATHNRDLIELIFEDRLSPAEQEYLKKNTLLLKMDKINNYTICESLDFDAAKKTCEDLLLDLRGI